MELKNGNASKVENAKVGYQAAIALWAYEGTTIWAKFTAMVYANTILIATLGLIVTSNNASKLTLMRIALSLLGLALCVCWILLTVRSFDLYKHWVLSSRELEKCLSPVRTVFEGGLLSDKSDYWLRTRLSPKSSTDCVHSADWRRLKQHPIS